MVGKLLPGEVVIFPLGFGLSSVPKRNFLKNKAAKPWDFRGKRFSNKTQVLSSTSLEMVVG